MTLPNLAALVEVATMAPSGTAEAKEKAYAVWALQDARDEMAALLIECAEALAEIANPNARKAREGQPHPSSLARAALARLADFDGRIG